MNALELANEIEQAIADQEFATLKSEKWHKDIAYFVRQQQEKIKNLEQWEKRQLDLIEHQQAEIEALKTENKFFKDLMGDVEILVKGKGK